MSFFRIDEEFVQQLRQKCDASWKEIADSFSKANIDLHLPAAPSHEQLRILVETIFWASLQREEGRTHDISVTFSPPITDLHVDPFIFVSPVAFNSDRLAKIAAALQSTQTKIGVSNGTANTLAIWGFSSQPVAASLNVRTIDPGQVMLSVESGTESFKASITGSRGDFIDSTRLSWLADPVMATETEAVEPTPDAMRKALETYLIAAFRDHDYQYIAQSMRDHAHGGTLLIVSDAENWKSSIQQPLTLAPKDPYDVISRDAKRYDEAVAEDAKRKVWVSERAQSMRVGVNEGLKLISQLTALDGATIINRDLTIYAFGVKIKRRSQEHTLKTVLISEPFEGSKEQEIPIGELGGTRHQSGAQFVFDQRNSIAIVASQDRRLSVVSWDQQRESVSITRNAEFALL